MKHNNSSSIMRVCIYLFLSLSLYIYIYNCIMHKLVRDPAAIRCGSNDNKHMNNNMYILIILYMNNNNNYNEYMISNMNIQLY